jgi:hypothetical protein
VTNDRKNLTNGGKVHLIGVNKEFVVYGTRQSKKHTAKSDLARIARREEEEEVLEGELKPYVWGGRRSG